ncbi:MAG TPA: hypothetical protein DCX53_12530 [Anaerolineae bacterium]|nr:hypothetical protein [Anaerolineae bacterium]
MSGPAAYARFESVNGAVIHRLPLEAFPNFWVYAYLVLKDECRILIDCGSGTDPSHENLLSGLQRAGLATSDLTHILLTHAHIDHYGGLSQLKPLTDAKIGCHELDVPTISDHNEKLDSMAMRHASFLIEAGLDQETVDALLGIYRFTKSFYRSVPVDMTYEAHELQIGPLEMIHLPGHCAGHVAMRLDDIIFCGDMVVEGVTPHLFPRSISPYNGLDHYLASLEKLQIWSHGSRLILSGHDDIKTDLSTSIEASHQNIIHRMSKAVEALHVPLTIAEVCTAVYGETDGYQKLLVIEKTGAYIEYFDKHGMIEVVSDAGIKKYRRLGGIPDDGILSKLKYTVIE